MRCDSEASKNVTVAEAETSAVNAVNTGIRMVIEFIMQEYNSKGGGRADLGCNLGIHGSRSGCRGEEAGEGGGEGGAGRGQPSIKCLQIGLNHLTGSASNVVCPA